MKNTKRIVMLSLLAGLLLLSTACAQLKQDLDVIGQGSADSFEALLLAAPEQVEETAGGWAFQAPDGSSKFIWSGEWSQSSLDALLVFDAVPFLAAGLDAAKLPEAYAYDGETITVGVDLGAQAAQGDATPLGAYGRIVRLAPDSIGYHSDMDHFGVSLGGGNMFEWAKDLGANDKDIVFALNPEPLIAAGVDPNAVEGWAFAKVSMHEGGKTVEVEKLLKPFNLA